MNASHDYPRIARESGLRLYLRKTVLSLSEVGDLDLDAIAVNGKWEDLESYLELVKTCELSAEATQILDRGFVTLFRLAQLQVIYLHHCVLFLDRCVLVLQEQLASINEENEKLQKANSERNNAFKCSECPKSFMTENYLTSHYQRRHSSPVKTVEQIVTTEPRPELHNASTTTNDLIDTRNIAIGTSKLPVRDVSISTEPQITSVNSIGTETTSVVMATTGMQTLVMSNSKDEGTQTVELISRKDAAVGTVFEEVAPIPKKRESVEKVNESDGRVEKMLVEIMDQLKVKESVQSMPATSIGEISPNLPRRRKLSFQEERSYSNSPEQETIAHIDAKSGEMESARNGKSEKASTKKKKLMGKVNNVKSQMSDLKRNFRRSWSDLFSPKPQKSQSLDESRTSEKVRLVPDWDDNEILQRALNFKSQSRSALIEKYPSNMNVRKQIEEEVDRRLAEMTSNIPPEGSPYLSDDCESDVPKNWRKPLQTISEPIIAKKATPDFNVPTSTERALIELSPVIRTPTESSQRQTVTRTMQNGQKMSTEPPQAQPRKLSGERQRTPVKEVASTRQTNLGIPNSQKMLTEPTDLRTTSSQIIQKTPTKDLQSSKQKTVKSLRFSDELDIEELEEEKFTRIQTPTKAVEIGVPGRSDSFADMTNESLMKNSQNFESRFNAGMGMFNRERTLAKSGLDMHTIVETNYDSSSSESSIRPVSSALQPKDKKKLMFNGNLVDVPANIMDTHLSPSRSSTSSNWDIE